MRRATVALLVVILIAAAPAAGNPQQAPKRGGSVTIGGTEAREPACLNPLIESCLPDFLGLLHLVLAGAFDVTPAATFRPDLVASAEIIAKQPFTLLYHIRPEARWSDGTPVTARDFVFTHQAILKHRPTTVLEEDHLTRVRSVRALDAKTVRVVLRARYPDWRYFFGWVLPRHALAGQDLGKLWQKAIDNPRTSAPIGSGPFLVERFERGRQLVLRRNPRYWGPHMAYLGRIVQRFMPPQDTAEALRQGEIDMIDPGPAVLQAGALELRRQRVPGIRVISGLGAAYEHFDIRMGAGGHPALRNRLVRQALAYGIDREEVARAVGALTGESDARPQDSVVFLANSPYYRPSWNGYRYRPAQARRLLQQAGCRRGADRIYICGGERLSLRFATAAGVERRERTVELAQAQLRQVGVEVRPVYARPVVFGGTILPSGEFDLALFGWILDASTAWHADVFGCQRPSNYTGYCDRLMTRDLSQATRILDVKRRVRLLNKIDVRLAKAVPAIPLFQNSGLFAFKATVRGVVPNGAGRFTWNAEDWWLER